MEAVNKMLFGVQDSQVNAIKFEGQITSQNSVRDFCDFEIT